MPDIVHRTLACGLDLLVEPMPGVSSAAMTWKFPAGAAGDPASRLGESALLNEYTARGAGGLTSRQHSDALDRVGVERSSSVGVHHLTLAATMLGSNVPAALPLFAAVARDPMLPADALEAVKSLCVQAIESIKDDPQHEAMIRLRERHVPAPFNRHGYGEIDHINAMTIDDVRRAWKQRCVPRGTIVALAGAVDADQIAAILDGSLTGWTGACPEPGESAPAQRGIHHIEQPSAQVHIGIACDAPREADENAMLERLAVAVLSGGMSGRLFTEVREKRSLCYSVGASYGAERERGVLTIYSGTTPERAQETLDVCLAEMKRLEQGVTIEEFKRAVVGLKSRLVMQGESTGARASAIARDFHRLGRARTLDEIARAVDALTLESLNAYLSRRAFGPFTVVAVGPTALRA